MNLVFAGTPEFAVPTLEALITAGHSIRAVYTQPDRPAGRGRRTKVSPVKAFALKHGLEINQPVSLESDVDKLWALEPSAMIVVAYGLILPPAVLRIPAYGCLNVHASLLPRWRGAAPIARAIEAGNAVTGVTIMQMDAGLDTGKILAQAETPIHTTETAASLHERLARLGADTLVHTLERLERGEVRPRAQDESRACYADKLSKEEAAIDWSQPAMLLERRIRAFNPWPVAHSSWLGKHLRIWEAAVNTGRPADARPGTVVSANNTGIRVATGDGTLVLRRLQLEGGKPQSVAAFLNGHHIDPGDYLG